MWDNREGKKNPKAPDYKCKDEGCKWKQTKDGSWERSEYQTGAWDKEVKKEWAPEAVRQQYAPTTVVKEDKPDWDKIAEGKVRHGVVCAMIEAGKTYEEIATTCEKYVKLIINEQPF